jgi:hypothetical protein
MKIHFYKLITLVLFSIIVTSCASKGKSIGLGGTIGAGTGAALGGIINPGKNGEYRTRNVIIGAGIGGIAGMFAGNAIHDNNEKKQKEAFEKGKQSATQNQSSGVMPELRNPKVEARWVEGRVQGNRYVDGHFEYVIVEQARWEVVE